MSAIITSRLALPSPRVPITIREADASDLPGIDALQKQYGKQLGFMPRKALEGKIAAKQVLVATSRVTDHDDETRDEALRADSSFIPPPSSLPPLGYLIGQDQYFKRDDCGIVYQICIAPDAQRGFIGAALLKAQFDRSAYGCRLYCCWCAQDIAANHFWESMGFVPLAFRAGSEKKQRTHIFWQKRIRQNDTATPWWFPSETKGGSMMQDRLVFPIPPGTHWSDAKPIVLPADTHRARESQATLEGGSVSRAVKKEAQEPKKKEIAIPLAGALRFGSIEPKAEEKKPTKPAKKPKVKNDSQYVAAARELRDRYLERVNEDAATVRAGGKYALDRIAPSERMIEVKKPKQLAA